MKSAVFFMALSLCLSLDAQPHTVGLINADNSKTFAGYNLIYPSEQSDVFLLDNCGRVVHVWKDSIDYRPGNSVFLLENGVLLKTKRHSSTSGDPINGPGAGATVEKRDWDNNLLWTFTLNDSFSRLHHDITPMPNGNVLMISWDNKTKTQAIDKGRKPASINVNQIWPEKIIEVKPIGKDSFEIVWEWHEWDHLIQDADSTKPGYGDVTAHPEKIDINWGSLGGQGGSAWTFLNSIDYDEHLDQILVSSRFFNEIWIIDHSTNSQQATGSSGGKYGKGGDLLFRWGNPKAYKAGSASDQKTFSQHSARWMSKNPADTNYGRIILFNNMAGPTYSTVNILEPSLDTTAKQYQKNGATFLPSKFLWTYKRKDSAAMYSTGFGSAQLLPNGNMLICSGRQGKTFEVTPSNEIVWEYVVPFNFGVRASQGDSIPLANNSTFRAERFPVDFAAFAGKDLRPMGYIELKPDSAYCSLPTGIQNPHLANFIAVYPNPANSSLTVELNGSYEPLGPVLLYTMTGQVLASGSVIDGKSAQIDVSGLPAGLYFLSVNGVMYMTKLMVTH